MPRPQKYRKVCAEPGFSKFTASGGRGKAVLTVDEYESLRLMDHLGMTHGMCALHMGVSRTTVTEIYESARRKLADALVNGKDIIIEGGRYRLCDGKSCSCISLLGSQEDR